MIRGPKPLRIDIRKHAVLSRKWENPTFNGGAEMAIVLDQDEKDQLNISPWTQPTTDAMDIDHIRVHVNQLTTSQYGRFKRGQCIRCVRSGHFARDCESPQKGSKKPIKGTPQNKDSEWKSEIKELTIQLRKLEERLGEDRYSKSTTGIRSEPDTKTLIKPYFPNKTFFSIKSITGQQINPFMSPAKQQALCKGAGGIGFQSNSTAAKK